MATGGILVITHKKLHFLLDLLLFLLKLRNGGKYFLAAFQLFIKPDKRNRTSYFCGMKILFNDFITGFASIRWWDNFF